MNAKKLSTVTCHLINAYASTAKNVIHAYRAGGERVLGLLEQRWDSALKQSKSANNVKQVLHKFTLKGLTVSSGGAQDVVNQVVRLADAGVHKVAVGASRFEDKTGAHVLTTLADAALPGAVALSLLAGKIEQKSASLADKIAGVKVVATVARRSRTSARKPRVAAAPAIAAAA